MQSVNLNEAEFYGRVSMPPSNREAAPRHCRHCGSQLADRYRTSGSSAGRRWGSGRAPAARATRSAGRWRPRLPEPCRNVCEGLEASTATRAPVTAQTP